MPLKLPRCVDWLVPTLVAGAALTSFFTFGCAPEEPVLQRFSISLDATSTSGSPLAGVRFWANGHELGVTPADGHLLASVDGHEEDTVTISANCPGGYQGKSEPRKIHLQAKPNAKSSASAAIRLSTLCEAEEQLAALVVRALRGHENLSLPILVDGEVLGQTDADGVGHLLVPAATHNGLRVMLDTSTHPLLRPQNPVRVFRVDEDQGVLLFDQSFTVSRPRATKAAAKPAPRLPYRIQ